MSRLPDSTFGYSFSQTQEWKCRDCDAEWAVEGMVDMNEWEPDYEKDLDCPKCNSHNTGSAL